MKGWDMGEPDEPSEEARPVRKLWSRESDTAYRAAVEATRPAPEDREVVFADMRQEIEAAVKRALDRLVANNR